MSHLTVADNTKLWFTADTHFGHKNIMKYTGRQFPTVQDMDDSIVTMWNSIVGQYDLVIHLGDFSFHSPEKSAELLDNLNGDIILVKGNHDSSKVLKHLAFLEVYDFLELKVLDNGFKQKIACMHYPMAVWPSSHYGAWHLHGHSHGTYSAETGKLLDVGWDVHHRPISFAEVKEYMQSRGISEVDHHSIKQYRECASS